MQPGTLQRPAPAAKLRRKSAESPVQKPYSAGPLKSSGVVSSV
jgi:hypothetical protein